MPYKRRFVLDVIAERLILEDRLGSVEMSLADIPGRVLTRLMLEGLASMLRKESDARTAWLKIKNGLAANPYLKRRAKKDRERKPTPLSHLQRAIILTIAEMPDCRATTDELETFVRGLSYGERQMWGKEPAVRLHCRLLMGQPISSLDSLLARYQA